jgi:hypothetical protein
VNDADYEPCSDCGDVIDVTTLVEYRDGKVCPGCDDVRGRDWARSVYR